MYVPPVQPVSVEPFPHRKLKLNSNAPLVAQYRYPTSGPIIHLPTFTQLGTHQGIWDYTIGQGIRIGCLKEKMYVVKKTFEEEGECKRGVVWVAAE